MQLQQPGALSTSKPPTPGGGVYRVVHPEWELSHVPHCWYLNEEGRSDIELCGPVGSGVHCWTLFTFPRLCVSLKRPAVAERSAYRVVAQYDWQNKSRAMTNNCFNDWFIYYLFFGLIGKLLNL